MTLELNKVYNMDVLQGLKQLPDASVDCVVTSPPYWALRNYELEPIVWDGKEDCQHEWKEEVYRERTEGDKPASSSKVAINRDNDLVNRPSMKADACNLCGAWRGCLGLEPTFKLYLKHLLQIFDEVKRVLKPTGTVFVNLGDTYHNATKWTNKEESPQSISKGNNRNYKTGRKNNQLLPEKSLCMIPYRFAIAMQDRGWILRNVNVWWKRNCMPSSVKDRFTVDFEPVFFFVKERKYFFDMQREPHKLESFKRNLYGEAAYPERMGAFHRKRNAGDFLHPAGRAMRTVWDITTQPFKEAHFATFPEALPERCIKAGCPEFVCNKCGKPREVIYDKKFVITRLSCDKGKVKEVLEANDKRNVLPRARTGLDGYNEFKQVGLTDCNCNAGFSGGVVLDPFAGAGTTCLVARKLGRQFIGFELNPDYVKMAERRIKPFMEQQKLV